MKALLKSMAKKLPVLKSLIAQRNQLQEMVLALTKRLSELQADNTSLLTKAAEYEELERQNAGLRSHNEELCSQNEQLQRHAADQGAQLAAVQTFRDLLVAANYNHDSLMVWCKNPTFLKEPRFLRAYARAMNSGHNFGQALGMGNDIHIEWRVYIACCAGFHAMHLPGDFVECGVNTGMFSLALCDYIDFNTTGKTFYLFDTYNGIPEEQMQADELDRIEYGRLHYSECYDLACRNFQDFPRARLIRGKVPASLAAVDIDKVCYLSLDMNIARPEVEALKFFWDKLVTGAVVVLDDYLWMSQRSQKEKLDEFAKTKGVEIFSLPTGQGLLIKP